MVAKTREQYVKNNKVTENVKFNNPSTTANFVTGHSSDGFSTWKTLKQSKDENKGLDHFKLKGLHLF